MGNFPLKGLFNEVAKMDLLNSTQYEIHRKHDGSIIFGITFFINKGEVSDYVAELVNITDENKIKDLESKVDEFTAYLKQFLSN